MQLKHFLIRDVPLNFAKAVVELIENPELWHKLQLNGRQLVESEYDWTAIFAEYEQELIQMSQRTTKGQISRS